jgi:hypothetical protein
MVTLAGSQVWWTWDTEDSFRQVREGDKHALKTYAAKLTGQLTQLTGMVSRMGEILRRYWVGRGPDGLLLLSLLSLLLLLIWECLLHVSTFATTRVALPTGVKPG